MSTQGERVLAIGAGPILISMAESWFDSGLSDFSAIITSSQPADAMKLTKCWEQAFDHDPDASLNIRVAAADKDLDWNAAVRPYSLILYVSQNGDLAELRKIQQACLAEKKRMLPAVVIGGRGLAGPLLLPDGSGRWDSAWRRIHSPVFSGDRPESIPIAAAAVLSDILVHEARKAVRGEKELHCRNQCFLLNPGTLTGSWHPIRTHPLVCGNEAVRPVENIRLAIETSHEPADRHEWFSGFTRLTSAVAGIFHVWEEADLIQLPLAQCLVQPADPLSPGPADLMPAIVRSGLTHEEARRESGLAGLEAYAARLMPQLLSGSDADRHERIGIGAGCTVAEAVGRGLRACLTHELGKRSLSYEQSATRLTWTQIEDVRCRYYLQALSIMDGEPLIAAGESLFGFPVVWVYSGSSWYGSADFSFTLALRQSLQKALEKTEGAASFAVVWNDREPQDCAVAGSAPTTHASLVLSAIQRLKQNNIRFEVFDMRSELFLGEEPFIIYGVILGEEESP